MIHIGEAGGKIAIQIWLPEMETGQSLSEKETGRSLSDVDTGRSLSEVWRQREAFRRR